MLKAITDARCDNSKVLLHLETLHTLDRLHIDRSDRPFGGHASLTQQEINESLEIAKEARKRTAW
ncbi:MAG: hypothetical protein IJ272_02075 [Clostridia bacterium]|nr:hypothetical protein [Clostridia bacterium]